MCACVFGWEVGGEGGEGGGGGRSPPGNSGYGGRVWLGRVGGGGRGGWLYSLQPAREGIKEKSI